MNDATTPLDLDAIEARRRAIATVTASARFIREDVPALVAEVRKLRDENERLRWESCGCV